jgi:hypothetical protein
MLDSMKLFDQLPQDLGQHLRSLIGCKVVREVFVTDRESRNGLVDFLGRFIHLKRVNLSVLFSGSGHNAADFYSNVLHAMLIWPNRKQQFLQWIAGSGGIRVAARYISRVATDAETASKTPVFS